MSYKILFRCDANAKSGFGHFSRCLSFARTIKKTTSHKVFFHGNYNSFAIAALNNYQLPYANCKDDCFTHFDRNIFTSYDYVVVDSYFITQTFIDQLASLPVISVYIDDECILDFSKAHWVVNFRVGAESFTYTSKNKALGSNYYIANPDFKYIRLKNTTTCKIKNLLLFFGGSFSHWDIANEIIHIIREIDRSIEISCITSTPEQIKCKYTQKILPTFDIHQIYSKTDAIINGGGLIKYDCAYCLIPGASLSTTLLQHNDTMVLQKRNLLYNLGFIDECKELKKTLCKFIQNHSVRQKIFSACQKQFCVDSNKNLLDKILR